MCLCLLIIALPDMFLHESVCVDLQTLAIVCV